MEKYRWKLVESKTTFPPFQGILLEDSSKQARAIPLLSDEANQLSGIDKRVQSVSEQVKLDKHCFKRNGHTYICNQ
jgi:hypothetical protein